MPAYNFEKRFANLVREGIKTHTIRKPRARKTKAGEKLALYTGMRTSKCEKLRDATCTKVVPIHIALDGVEMEGHTLDADELEAFARSDGFASTAHFLKFWCETYGLSETNPQEMEVIYWK